MFKKEYPKKRESDFWIFMGKMFDLIKKAGGMVDPDIHFAEFASAFFWKFRKMDHYFISDGLYDFCSGSVKDFTCEYYKPLPLSRDYQNDIKLLNGKNATVEELCVGLPNETRAFACHFPASEKRNSIIIIPDFCSPVTEYAAKHYLFSACDGMDIAVMQLGKFDEKMNDVEDLCKFVFGLSLYMDAFPETVVPSSTEDVSEIRHYRGTHHSIGANEIARKECQNMISPHFRRGHWRLLSSPHFVRKQGQTIYIEGCYVKGKAFDVLADSPAVAA